MRILVLTRGYPHGERLYNHAFVHRRVLAYRARGHAVRVFWLRHRGEAQVYSFEDVEVIQGGPEACLQAAFAFAPDCVAAHAPADDFWPVLSQLLHHFPVSGWIYGSEILPFHTVAWREDDAPAERDKVRATHARRLAFWRHLLDDWPAMLRLVFVSHHAREAAARELGRAVPQAAVLPSPVDTALFAAPGKDAAHRLSILSVRPFSDWRYANDLSVRAVLALRDHPLFPQMRFRIMGEGRLFGPLTEPLAGLSNVRCESRFLTQADLAQAHGDAGVFLCPSRDDAQGVSRDEAMSSGLVPVVSAVGAVPEFVDHTCAMLTAPEDAEGLALALATLAQDPARFLDLSRAAAARVRDRLAMERIVPAELALLKTPVGVPADA